MIAPSDWAKIMGSLCNVLTATNSSLNMWIYLNKVKSYQENTVQGWEFSLFLSSLFRSKWRILLKDFEQFALVAL